jgi:hypothetical protein
MPVRWHCRHLYSRSSNKDLQVLRHPVFQVLVDAERKLTPGGHSLIDAKMEEAPDARHQG